MNNLNDLNNLNEASAEDIKILEENENLLTELRKVKIQGTILRSRRYKDLGEKASSYVLLQIRK